MTTTPSKTSDVIFLRDTPEGIYYSSIDRETPTVLVLGEIEEQWTSMTMSYLEHNSVSVVFLPWSQLQEVRLSSELVYYPITQLWMGGKLQQEVVGYHAEELRQVINLFFHAKRQRVGD